MRTLVLTAALAAAAAVPATGQVHRAESDLARLERLGSLHQLAHIEQSGALQRLERLGSLHQLARIEQSGALQRLEHLGSLNQLARLEQLGSLQQLERLGELAYVHTGDLEFIDDDAGVRLPPDGWDQEDPADSLWRAARRALDGGNASSAAATYRRIRTDQRYARSTYRAPSFYWEAYARDRMGTTTERRNALNVLTELRRAYPRYEDMEGVSRLQSSITASLAAAGDPRAAARTQENASRAASSQCPNNETQAMALEALMHMSTENALPIVQRVMSRRDACNAELRKHATFLLSRMQGEAAENLLIETVRSDPDNEVKQQAVFWLSRVNSERALEAIETVLRSPSSDEDMLQSAAHALSQHQSPRAAALLRDIATRPGSTEARASAIHWLGNRGDQESATFLRNLYSSVTDADLKDAVLFALSRQKGVGNEEFLLGIAMNEREPMSARTTALHWAGTTGAVNLARLVQIYNGSSSEEMKRQIIHAISRRSEPEALDRLIEIARRETNVELRKNAVFWIGRVNDPRAARFIAELIDG